MRIPEKKMFALKEGDIVERQMQNGDWVIFNRQPTLWIGSMQGKKVIIRPGKTFRFSLSCTQAMNADYDGDMRNN
jgi:DNA-directed RNA polymerase subunit A'